ncbi:non-heme chloroperoxidase [Periconia macrospinosa]|uniref:Non-heme chloroperoxidase n=1 Tax=Periconia macrospinosa TaxID=97972 RepID=A0A2V1DI49_9PLEO|nr:non-heme chloroperoxidase [Periconia macrospinosa]
MPYLSLQDGVRLFYKDWGNPTGQPVFFSHGWPLNSDNWETQMNFLGNQGYRVIAHDRRGHGRSDQPWHGNNVDTWADDIAQLFSHLDLTDVTLVGHSTGGGDLVRFAANSKAQSKTSWVKKLVLVSAVTPGLLRADWNPNGVPIEGLNQQRALLLKDRAQFFYDVPEGPFFGFNRPNATVSKGLIQSWFNQGMQASIKSTFDTIAAWETDFRPDLRSLDIPVLVIHGDDDQIVPFGVGNQTVGFLKNGRFKVYEGGPHALPNIRADEVNNDLLAFLKET